MKVTITNEVLLTVIDYPPLSDFSQPEEPHDDDKNYYRPLSLAPPIDFEDIPKRSDKSLYAFERPEKITQIVVEDDEDVDHTTPILSRARK